jgi:DNA-binding SARP family transcriptional activator
MYRTHVLPPPLRVRLLGAPSVEVDGAPLVVDTRKAIAVLAYVVTVGRPVPRESLAALLWAESGDAEARGALRRTLSVLNSGLGGHGLTIDRTTITVRPEEIDADLWQFASAVAAVRAHAHPVADTCPACIRRLEEAASLGHGDFLAGFSIRDSEEFETWQLEQTEGHRRELAGVLERLSRVHAARGAWADAIGAARRWLELDPLHEAAHRALMEALARAGERAASVGQYRSCVRILDRELGVAPLAETSELLRRIEAGELDAPEPRERDEPAIRPSRREAPLPFMGRDRELSLIEAGWRAARDGAQLVVVTGEAGVGKTRLVDALLERAHAAGARVLVGRAHDGEQAVAYGPIVAALRGAVGEPDRPDLAGLLAAGARREAARLVPELDATGEGVRSIAPANDPAARLHFLEGVATTIGVLANGPQPGILAIDDIQWSDDATLEVLAAVVHRPGHHRLAIVLTVRPEDLGDREPWAALRRSAARDGLLTEIELRRLEPAVVAELVARTVPGAPRELVERLVTEAEGLPLVLVESLAVLAGAAAGTAVPSGMRAVFASRLRELSATARQVLDAAAVFGRPADPILLRSVSGRSEEETAAGLDELAARALVRELPAAGEYDVAHGRIRELVLESLGLARRRLLHRRAAEAIAGRSVESLADQAVVDRLDGADSSLVAGHLRTAGRDAAAALVSARAGDHARSVFANAEALVQYEAALAFGHPEPARLHESRGELNTLAGDYASALDAYATALAIGGALRGPDIARLEHAIGLVHARLGAWETAERHAATADEAAGTAEHFDIAARRAVDRGLIALRRGDREAARHRATRAGELAAAAADPDGLARAENLFGLLAAAEGAHEAAARHLESSLRWSSAQADPTARIAALNNLARTRAALGDTAGAIELVATALEACLAQGDRHREAALHNHLADLLHFSGRREEALDELKRAVAIFAEIGGPEQLQPGIWQLEAW